MSFSRTCVRCSSGAEVTYGLAVAGGRRVRVPVCVACADRLVALRLAWVIATLVIAGLGSVGVAVASDILVTKVPSLDHSPAIIALGLVLSLAFLVAVPWAAFRRGMHAFHRRLGPVWLVRVESAKAVVLGARHVVRVETPGQRLPAASLPPWAVTAIGVALGCAVAAAGLAEYEVLGRAEARRERVYMRWIEVLAYDLGGRGAVLSLFAGLGVVLVVLGILAGAARRRARGERGCEPHRAPERGV